MPSPHQLDESHAASTTNSLSALLDAHACSICHDLLSAPVALPCSHIFCSQCVRRHLSTKSFCPHPTCRNPTTYMQLTPLRAYDVALEPLRRTAQKVEPTQLSEQKRLVFLSRKASSRAQFMERLREHGIPTHGATNAMANRYNDFVIRWNANLDAGVPKSKKSIVSAVLAAERGMGKESMRLRGASSFFMRASSPKNEGDVELPAQGDDFATLVEKTRARMERKRKLCMAAAGDEKRVCLTATAQNLKQDGGLQRKEEDDGDNDNCEVPEPHHCSVLSQPKRAPRNNTDPSREDIAALSPNESIAREKVSSQCLSISYNVCSLNIASNEIKNNTGNTYPQRSIEGLEPPGRSTARIFPMGAIWSQTTPEKHIVPVTDGEELIAITDRENAVVVSKNQPSSSGTDAVVKVSNFSGRHCPNGKSSTPQPRRAATVLRRPRAQDSLNTQSPKEENLSINLPEPPLQLQYRVDTEQKSTHSPQQDPSLRSGDNESPSSRGATPTKAQLERAERNRLEALEKRRRFYERQGLSQMRQPDL